jgi:hypothetical protein
MLMLMMAMVMASRYGADRGYKFHSTSYVKHLYGDIMGESASWANYHIAVVKRKEEEPTINNVYAQARPYDPSISGRRHVTITFIIITVTLSIIILIMFE